jgi:hypothetical protein
MTESTWQSRYPSFYIVGAPKCGTTTLFDWLKQHPDTYLPVKEPNYLSEDIYDPFPERERRRWTMQEYLEKITPAHMVSKVTGEATPKYLYSDTALNTIGGWASDTRIIVLIRNPVELVVSLHNQFCKQGIEKESSFYNAWYISQARKDIRMNYMFWGTFGARLKRLYEIFPAKNVLVMVLEEEMQKAPELAYQRVLRFLGLPQADLPDLSRSNSATGSRSFLLNQATSSLRRYARKKGMIGKYPAVANIARRVTQLNSLQGNKTTLDEAFRTELASYFSSDVQLTAELLGRTHLPWGDFYRVLVNE